MNILILNWRDPKNPKSGGAEVVTMEHAKAWVKAGKDVFWFTSFFPNAQRKEVIEGVKIVRRGSPVSVILFAPFFYFFSGIHFDVVIDEIHGLPFFTPLYVKSARKIAFIHEIAGEIWDYVYPFPISFFGKALESFYFNLYRNVPFWTDAPSTINELIQKKIPKENCIAIPCPITNKVINSLPKKEKRPTFIFVSRLVKMKGAEDVIKAFSILLSQEKNAQLWIVGGGEENYIKKLIKLTKILKVSHNTTFWGKVSDRKKLTLMRRAHLLLHASVKEGWGLVVLEAASQATPAVVYNVSGLCDSVKNGKTGILLRKNSPNMMAQQGLLLLKNSKKYKKLQLDCLSWVKQFSWRASAKMSLALFEK